MNFLRSLFALLLAISIASPACCCTPRDTAEPATASHCCGGAKEDPEAPVVCNCSAETPKQLEDPPCLPGIAVAMLPPVPVSIAFTLPAVPLSEAAPPDFYGDTGPPRLRLALWQRFLI